MKVTDSPRANERAVTLTADGESWRYAVAWSERDRQYRVRALDEGWHVLVHPADVPSVLTARNIAIAAVAGMDGEG